MSASLTHASPVKPGSKLLNRILVLMAAGFWNLPAQAMINQVTYQVQYDGTADFNLNRTGPGFDAGPRNGIVRTHDAVGYEVTLSTNGPDTTPVIVLTLPQVNGRPLATWAMPTQCRQPGSGISGDGQTITCRMEDFASSGTKSLVFNATVRGDVRNDTPLPAPAINVTSDKVKAGKAPDRLPPPLTVTAAPFYDVRVQMSHQGVPAAYGAQAESGPRLPNRQDGVFHRPLIGVFARNPDRGGKKGVEQLDPAHPIEIQLDISGYPSSVRVMDWDDGATKDYRKGCGSAVRDHSQVPGLLGGGRVNTYGHVTDHGPSRAPDEYTVANGGSCKVQPGANRNAVTISLSGVDSKLETYPTRLSRTNGPIRDEFWIANKALVLWTDLVEYPSDQLISHRLRFHSIHGRSISGQDIPPPSPNPGYHQISHDLKAQGRGETDKTYVPDDTATAPWAAQKDPAILGDHIVNHMSPGQSVRSVLRFSNTGTLTAHGLELCDILDRNAFDLRADFSADVDMSYLKDPGAVIRLQYGAPPAGESPYFASVDSAISPYEVIGKYSVHGSSSYSQASCLHPGIRWFDTPRLAEAAGGLVYVKASINRIRPQGIGLLHIRGIRMRERWAATATVQTPSPGIRQAGDTIPEHAIIRNRAEIRSANIATDITRQRDHLMVVPTRTTSRISKTIIEPAAAKNAPVAAGSVLTYEIVPRYSTLYPPLKDTVTITDILPKGTYYLDDTATVGGVKMEPAIQENTPAAGMTTLIWTFPDQLPHFGHDADPGARMPAIRFKARLSNHLVNGSLVRNLAWIHGGANDFEDHCRYHAASQTLVMTRPTDETEVPCDKGAKADTQVQTPPGFLLEKRVLRKHIEPGDPFGYTLAFVSMGQEISAPNVPDMIDILPFVGDGESRPAQGFTARDPASKFDEGAYRLVSVTPPARDATARIYFTNRPPKDIHNDPRDASNALTGGSTKWCLPAEFGTAGCPATIGDSTAVRVSPSLRLLQANIPYEVQLSLVSDPLRSHHGNIFANHVGTRPADPASKLLFVHSDADLNVRIVQATGGLSGRVFTDLSQNNVFEAGDRALAAQCMQVSGTNRKGQTVLLSTRSDTEGRFAFTPGLLNTVFHSGDCTGTPLARFGGLLEGTYTLTRLGSIEALPGALHAGTQGGSVDAPRQRIHDIRLGTGAHGVDYHFTEQPVAPRLTLSSTVTNDHGGQASTADIPLSATLSGQPAPAARGTSGSPAVTRAGVPAGDLMLAAPALPGYRTTPWQCTVNGQPVAAATPAAPPAPHTLTLRHGDEAVCSVHYDDEPARLTLVSTVTNANGQNATPQDFVLHAQGPVFLSGVTGEPTVTGAEVLPGVYELREDELPNYVAGAWHCDAGTLDGHRLTLANGEHATCTINNTDQPVSLTLVLDVINEHGGTATERDTSVSAHGPDSIDGISGTEAVTVAPVRPGVYRLPLPSLPGYVTGKWVCSGGTLEGDLLTIGRQQNITCRIVLKDIPATLTTSKAVVGEVRPVEGTSADFEVQYRLTVRHEAGAAALYALTDTPAFDPDVQILDARITRNGLPVPAAVHEGGWMLAERQRLAIGAEDVYLMDFRIRVPYGSNTANNRCASGTTAQGRGLFNQLSLRNLSADAPQGASLAAEACIDTPLPVSKARLSVEKTSASHSAEVGDLISYRLRIRNHGDGPAISPVVLDRLPAGFRVESGSVRVQNARAVGITQAGVRELRIRLDRIEASDADVIITYRVRLGVGSQEGDGTNRVHVECLTPNGAATAKCSNESRWKVQVRAGIFSEEACVAGQVFVDCNGNSAKDPEELGIPGVRLYLQNGTWMVTDSQGKYNHCGLRPRTHVLKVDGRTLPRRSRLVTSSARNSGDAQSLFIDARKGMLHRADFIEGSCSNTVIEQVKARQAQGETTSVQTEAGQASLAFDSKRGVVARPRQQGTDPAGQPMGRARY